MAHNPSPVVASELVKTIMVKNYFYRIRMEAARALVNVSNIVAHLMIVLFGGERVHRSFLLIKSLPNPL